MIRPVAFIRGLWLRTLVAGWPGDGATVEATRARLSSNGLTP